MLDLWERTECQTLIRLVKKAQHCLWNWFAHYTHHCWDWQQQSQNIWHWGLPQCLLLKLKLSVAPWLSELRFGLVMTFCQIHRSDKLLCLLTPKPLLRDASLSSSCLVWLKQWGQQRRLPFLLYIHTWEKPFERFWEVAIWQFQGLLVKED